MSRFVLLSCLGLAALALPALALPAAAQELPELAVVKYELANGLDVILHEDHSVPVVGVNIWYHVGSKNEKAGRTGFAHLFEHMMFQGSEHHDTDYFFPLKRVGAFVNGSTSEDRTNYLEDVPSNCLELALWLESDRMGYLLPAMTQERLDEQRGVVQNEKREGMNEPYSASDELLKKLLYPSSHPYAHTVIGAMEDLGAATLEDVQEFFRLYYAPNNASLCLSGDFQIDEAKRLIEKYFGPIPAGLPVEEIQQWVPRLDGERRAVAEDEVELPRLWYAWNTPDSYQPGDAELDLLGNILATGKTSRLYKKLVYEQAIAQEVHVYQSSGEICGQFVIDATARPGHSLAELEAAIDAELRALLDEGVSRDELALAQTAWEVTFVRRLQRVGGFGGKADKLNDYNVNLGDPNRFQWDLARYRQADVQGLNRTLREYLTLDNRAVLHIVPQGDLQAAGAEFDRNQMPAAAGDHAFTPPAIERATLDNGLEVVLVAKRGLPLAHAILGIRSGWSDDPADRLGTAALTAELLDEGTRKRDALEISEAARALGATLNTGSFFDGSQIGLNLLARNLDAGLELMREVAMEASFPEQELQRQRQIYLGRIQQESSQPFPLAIKTLQRRIYGEGHPYAQPFTGSGTESSLAALTRDDLVRYHALHYKPNNACLVLVGDLSLAEAVAKAEKAFGKWRPGELEHQASPPARPGSASRLIVVDRPGSPQSFLLAGELGFARNSPDFLAMQMLDTALGAHFASRLNMNLREDKRWSYGAYSILMNFRQTGMIGAWSSVETKYTKEALAEMRKELTDIIRARPLSDQEMRDSRDNLVKGFPRNFETYGDIANQTLNLVTNELSLDEWRTFADRVGTLRREDVLEAGRKHLKPEEFCFVVVGDYGVIGEGLRQLGLGEIEVVDAAGL